MNAPRSYSRRVPLIIASTLFIENMDATALATALPSIAADFGGDPVALKLALTAYMIALAVFIPVSAWVADRFGSRPTFVAAIAVFLLGSIGCAASSSLGELVAARFLQGAGGALMVPVGRLVLLRSIPKHELVQALSWLTVPALIGPMLGPPLGGLLVTHADWRWIFLINLPIGLLGMWLGWRYVPEIREPAPPLDRRGFLLSALGLALAMFGFATLGRHLLDTGLAVAAITSGFTLLALYMLHARRAAHPLLDLSLLRLTTFRSSVLAGSLFRIGVGALPFLLPLMLQLGFGYSALESGLLTFVAAIGAMFMKTIAAGVLRRFGFRRVLWINALLASAFLGAHGLLRPDWPYALMLCLLVLGGCFRSLQFTSLNAIAYAEVDSRRMGQASSLSGMMQQVSLSIGVVIGGYALQLSALATATRLESVANFSLAFLVVALFSASSAWLLWRLPEDAGHEMAGRARVGEEVVEPKPAQRPAT
jgi:EmrB/QacA subfamily drug resistance transporter